MARTIRVTPAQVKGAQFLVRQAELGGPPVTEGVRELARTRSVSKQVVRGVDRDTEFVVVVGNQNSPREG